MIRRLAVAAAIFSLVFFASLSYCQDEVKTVDGRVVSVDPQAQVIVVKSSQVFTFSVAPNANITDQEGLSIKLSDIKAENYVWVDYTDNGAGVHIAGNINVEYNR